MPSIGEISYSRDVCIAAVRDYYSFIVKMYVDESQVIYPPGGGWPNITSQNLKGCGKTDEVIAILRQLPYIAYSGDTGSPQAFGSTYFADWKFLAEEIVTGGYSAEAIREATEGVSSWQDVPSYVFGLTNAGWKNFAFLIDTERGIIHWPNCPGPLRLSRSKIDEAPTDFAPEDEEEWRGDSAWAIPDFFELLKDELRKLHSLPINSCEVFDVYSTYRQEWNGPDGIMAAIKKVYHEHGWPDLERYRKKECLEAINEMMMNRFPDHM